MPSRDLNKTNYSTQDLVTSEYRSDLLDAINGIKSELSVLGTTNVLWGQIFGSISSQADLVALFGTKQDLLVNSAGLLAALNDETGTGLAVFNNTPTLIGVNVSAGTVTVAPIKLNAGTSLGTPITGTIEFDGVDLFFTI